jgi:hypothetical protein
MRYTNTQSHQCLQVFLAILSLFLTTTIQAASINISLNKTHFIANEKITVFAEIDWQNMPVVPVDVYISLQTPEGYTYYVDNLNNIVQDIKPIVSHWTVSNIARFPFLNLPLNDRLPEGKYKWYFTIVKAGAEPDYLHHWLAYNSAEMIFAQDDLPKPSIAADADTTFNAVLSIFNTTTDTPSQQTQLPPNAPIMPQPSPALPVGSPSTLTAGDIDDNLNYNALLAYIERSQAANNILPTIDLSQRLTLTLQDPKGIALGNTPVRITTNNGIPLETYTSSNGELQLFPAFDNLNANATLEIIKPSHEDAGQNRPNYIPIDITAQQQNLTIAGSISTAPTQLDLMFVIDSTGSMQDELNYITTEIRDIIGNISSYFPNTNIRLSLMLYRDNGEKYITRNFPFSHSLNNMQNFLSEQRAAAGGDYPEAMEVALKEALQADWRTGNTARLMFLIADAPPHDAQLNNIITLAKQARQQGIRLYSVAGSGVAEITEYVMRIASVLTQARYLFLTDDSGVGDSHAEPSVGCYQVTHLNRLMMRVISSELAGQRIEAHPDAILRVNGGYNQGVCVE